MTSRRPFASARRPTPSSGDDGERVQAIVGFSHLILGALGVVAAGVGVLGAAALSPLLLIPVALRLVLDGLTCYAGLLINDGRRRGALVAIGTGVFRGALMAWLGSWGLFFVLTVLLVGASVWLLPQLSDADDAR